MYMYAVYYVDIQKIKPRLKNIKDLIKVTLEFILKTKKTLLFKILDCYGRTREFGLNSRVIHKDDWHFKFFVFFFLRNLITYSYIQLKFVFMILFKYISRLSDVLSFWYVRPGFFELQVAETKCKLAFARSWFFWSLFLLFIIKTKKNPRKLDRIVQQLGWPFVPVWLGLSNPKFTHVVLVPFTLKSVLV